MSIANRENAEECVSRAKKFLARGELDRAEKFLNKSINLYELDEARRLIRQLKLKREAASSASSSSGDSPSSSSHSSASNGFQQNGTQPRRRANVVEQTGPVKQDCTPEQREIVDRIRRLKDYYQVLGVEKDASEPQIKKAYKKLAMKLHPDKNHAPGASEAFKLVSSAYQCLTDPSKRRTYDQYGVEDLRNAAQANGHGHAGAHFHGEEMTPEELFAMFFGGGVRPRNGRAAFHFANGHRRQHHQQQQQGGPEAAFFGQLMHLAPILILMLFAFVGSLGPSANESPFRLDRVGSYTLGKTTSSGVPYFVDRNFKFHYERSQSHMRQIERMVEQEFMNTLRNECNLERRQRSDAIRKAKAYRGADQPERLHKAHKLKLHKCDDYELWYARVS